MAKPAPAGKNRKKTPILDRPGNVFFILLILAYGFVTVITPNWKAFDSNGPKFLTLAILNLVAFLILLSQKELKRDTGWPGIFMNNPVGLVYALLMLISLLSFVKAINPVEAFLTCMKVFTVFTAAFVVAIMVRYDKRLVLYLSVAMSGLLIIDSFTVFYHIADNILQGQGPAIKEIKSVYSNKNILSASIFVKIPFALYLLTFEQHWKKYLGILALVVAFVATLFMSTRAFYLGLVAVLLTYLPFMAIRYYRKNDLRKLARISVFVILMLAGGFTLFNFSIRFLYPKNYQDMYTVDFVSRFKTIAGGEKGRHDAWGRTLKLIGEHPLLGVGIGNWKVEVLKYENLTSPNYIYMYKNHNDFMEVAAETGIVGGFLFLAIFMLVFYAFTRSFFSLDTGEQEYRYLFIPAFGLLCYFFDAFFNFPADRPEISALFAIYTGMGVGFTWNNAGREAGLLKPIAPVWQKPASRVAMVTLLLVATVLAVWILYLNFASLKYQRMLAEDMSKGSLTLPSSIFIQGFPSMPDLNVQGEPIAVQKARYLISEKKYAEAINVLKADRSSPFDTRPEFFISNCYLELGRSDSAFYYFRKVFDQKPFFYTNTRNMAGYLGNKGQYDQAGRILEDYLAVSKDNAEAWIFAADMYLKAGNDQKALEITGEGMKAIPGNREIADQHRRIRESVRLKPYLATYQQALGFYNGKNFTQAGRLLTQILDKEPGIGTLHEYRAFCFYFMKDYSSCITDIELAMEAGVSKANLVNLLGVCHHQIGNDSVACAVLLNAIEMGDNDAKTNYDLFCKNVKR